MVSRAPPSHLRELLREGRELNDLRGRCRLAVVGALPTDAVARDRDCAVQFVELIAVNTNRLLTTPAETFRPGEVPERDALDAVALLERDLYLLILARGPEDLRRGTTRLHTFERLLGENLSGLQPHSG